MPIQWVCEYKECNNSFNRFPYQIRNDTGKYCSQVHASLASKRNYKLICKNCNKNFIGVSGTVKFCNDCKNSDFLKERSRNKYLTSRYGIELKDFNSLEEEQNGLCAICKKSRPINLGRHHLAVDHNHITGKVRGLLCIVCNTNLGWLESNLEEINFYLNKYK